MRRRNWSCPGRFRSDSEKPPAKSPPGRFAPAVFAPVLFPYVQLELPPIRPLARNAPDFERPQFRDATFDPDRHDHPPLAVHIERDLKRAEFLEICSQILQEISHVVLLADGGTQESKFGWFADDQPKFPVGNRGIGSL